MQNKAGFTLIELLSVLAISLIILAVLLNGFINYARYQTYQARVAEVVSTIVDAQAAAKVAAQDEHHGVYITSNQITSYSGNAYIAGNSTNVDTVFAEVNLVPNLTGGVSEIRFNKVTALPSVVGTIDIVGTRYTATTTITLTEAGVLYYE